MRPLDQGADGPQSISAFEMKTDDKFRKGSKRL